MLISGPSGWLSTSVILLLVHWGAHQAGALLRRSNTCNIDHLQLNGRLPSWLRPVHYELVIATDLEDDSFAGFVNITLDTGSRQAQANNPRTQVILHADPSLQILAIHLTSQPPAGRNRLKNVCRTGSDQLLVLDFADELQANSTYYIYFEFLGQLSYDMRAYYKASQVGPDPALDRPFAITQFESTEARRVFPCFDEPSFKATFALALQHADTVQALANTEIVATRPLEPREQILESLTRLTRFACTPAMSSYLLAFAVGNFDHVQRVLDEGRLVVRVYTPLGRAHEAEFALEMACRSVLAMEQYTGIQLPLRKLDLISVQDFESGAMENWGLITFKESQLLIESERSVGADAVRRLIAGTVLHEIAHQWFGDLVTMGWWNELWLNEGFATWLEFSLMQVVRPCAYSPLYYLTESHTKALQEDSRPLGRPVRVSGKLSELNDIEELYDSITYNKGAAVVHFLNDQLLGPHLFRQAIRDYLTRHSYGSVDKDDLWDSLETVSQIPIRPLIDPWINTPGYPVVTVELKQTTGQPATLKLTQARFFNPNNSRPAGLPNQHWFIPMTVLVVSGDNSDTLEYPFPAQEVSYMALPDWFDLQSGPPQSWLKVNANFSGFYRVQYSEELWARLEGPLRALEMAPADRLNILDDAQAFCRSDRMPVSRCLDTLSLFEAEHDEYVLQLLVKTFREIYDSFKWDTQVQKLLASFARQLFANKLPRRVHLKSWHHKEGYSMLHLLLVELGEPSAIRLALDWFEQAKASDRLLMPAVFLAVARDGSQDQFNSLLKIAETGLTMAESTRILEQLVRAQDMGRLKRVLSVLRNPKLKLDTPRGGLLQSMVQSKSGRQLVLAMFMESRDSEQLRSLTGGNPIQLAVGLASEMGQEHLDQVSMLLSSRLKNWAQLREILETEMRRQQQYRQWSRGSVMSTVRDYLRRSQSAAGAATLASAELKEPAAAGA